LGYAVNPDWRAMMNIRFYKGNIYEYRFAGQM
jgi:predicted fused transcriptional regulator/phosphomethylpyrimidine kinase